MKIIRFNALILVSLLAVSGCASLEGPTDPSDPFERYNRTMNTINNNLDRYVLKPVAKGYDTITPDPAQKGVSNFFSNLDDVLVIVNDLLQFKFSQLASDTGRFVINSTLGVFGIFDWATDFGLKKHREDFGQTLGYWGVPSGPYFIMPLLGPSTIRDTGGLVVDTANFDPVVNEIDKRPPFPKRDGDTALGLTALNVVNTRTRLLGASNLLEQMALDPYIFVREAYLQKRRNLVYDGNPPEEDFDEEEALVVKQKPDPVLKEDRTR